ncbi:MAG: A24 family peptidase [Planctomycetes bacterium]|nr:A24 family peptidase [Planctomycetota bacterium]
MPHWIAFGLLAVVLVTAAVTDCRTGKVYNALTYPAILAGLIFWSCTGYMQSGFAGLGTQFLHSLLALAAGYIPFALIFAAGGLGGGDVKLMSAVGAITAKPVCVLGTAFYALILAALFAIVLMIRKKIVRRTLSRLLGAALVLPVGVKPNLPNDSPRVPFAVAVCVGGLLAGTEHLLGVRLPWGGA